MSRGGGAGKNLHNVSWLWRAPRRALCAARDLYVRSLTGCAGHLGGDAAFGYPSFAAAQPPASSFRADSFASSSRRSSSYSGGAGDADEDLRELIRAASQRRVAEAAAAAAAAERHPAAVPRSHSVAMARIDEDAPCEFGGSAAAAVFPRSRSYAVGAGRRGRVAALAA
ncbi:unnamed protein product [Urochloa decumbens]|uniref:Uncharacterized protein n=1 Tax=Urochloa decumbens TaxID=240449 RepID=A0ABC9FN90_9POAL